jgi:PAS domain S-box-containing protein
MIEYRTIRIFSKRNKSPSSGSSGCRFAACADGPKIQTGCLMRVLILEDQNMDADLVEREARQVLPAADFLRVIRRDEFTAALAEFKPELILSDFQLPDFDGMEAIRLARAHDPQVPFLLITGATDEETAAATIRAGAWDYVLKDRLARLGPAITEALERRRQLEEQRRDLERLREREAIYRSLFTDNHAVMLIIDPASGAIIDANPAAIDYYGWKREELLVKRIDEINTLAPEEIRQEMARARGLGINHFHFQHRRADGGVRDVEVFSGPIAIAGQQLHYSIVHDVSQRLQAQRQLAEQRDRLQVILGDIATMIRQVTKNELTDIRLKLPLNQEACWQFMACGRPDCPSYGKEALQCWVVANTRCDSSRPEDGDFTRKIALCRQCRYYQKAAADPFLRIGMEFCRMMEVVDRKNRELQKAYEELKAAQAHLVQQEKMASIGALAAGVAHEINNPVGFIRSNLNTMARYTRRLVDYLNLQSELAASKPHNGAGELAERARALRLEQVMADLPGLISESQEGVERIRGIVSGLKSFSRPDQPRHQEAVDINQILEETLRVAWNELKYKAKITKNYGDLPLLNCYPLQLSQVFLNLLVNAAQAIAEQGEISLKTGIAGGALTVAIADDGEGIAPENRSRLFEPFFTTKEVGEGTGLGLSISYDIVVNQHGGRIEVESEPGRGSVFTVLLPLAGPPIPA